MDSAITEIQEQIEFIKELQFKKRGLEQSKALVSFAGSDFASSEEVKTSALALRSAVDNLDLRKEVNTSIFWFSSLLEANLAQAEISKECLQRSALTLCSLKAIEENLDSALACVEEQMQNHLGAVFASREKELVHLNAQIEALDKQLEIERGKLKSLLRVASKSDRAATDEGLSEKGTLELWDMLIYVSSIETL